MWWLEFEKCLTRALNAYVKCEGQVVHSDSMKIQMLIDKIKADFLTPTKPQLECPSQRLMSNHLRFLKHGQPETPTPDGSRLELSEVEHQQDKYSKDAIPSALMGSAEDYTPGI
jgi:hypothetical protein